MVKGDALRRKGADEKPGARQKYDHVKELMKIAAKNEWDVESLKLISKDLPKTEPIPLSKKQVQDRNRKIKNVLKRFGEVLTPPVPQDLEQHIRGRDSETWLPWEAEAIEKIDRWRDDIQEIKPQIIKELAGIWHSVSAQGR